MPEISFRVNAVTVGGSSMRFEHLRKPYVHGGDKRDDEIVSAPLADSSAARKRRRLEKLAALQAEHPDLSLAEKARRMGLAEKTVRGYLRELEGRS